MLKSIGFDLLAHLCDIMGRGSTGQGSAGTEIHCIQINSFDDLVFEYT